MIAGLLATTNFRMTPPVSSTMQIAAFTVRCRALHNGS